MTRIGFIGLGKLGLPVAMRLAKAGHDVIGFDRSADRRGEAAGRGLGLAGDGPAAVAGAAFVFTSLPDDAALKGALLADAGLVQALAGGAILVETSTVSPEASASVAEALAARDVGYLRSPVSGNPVLAEAGTLTAMASGPRAAFDLAVPVLEAFTKAQVYLGEAEQARYAKLAINLMIAVSAGMMADALVLAEKGEVPWAAMLDLMAESAVGSPMVKYKVPPLKTRDYSSTFSCGQMAKDLDLILGAASAAGLSLPYGDLARATYRDLIESGRSDADFIAAVERAEERAGLGPR
ncbi:NAD(P)-dependent oxidoreductase [Phreatobacter stygius]|uniref:NAD(P)-dependent oxidoreductase n=1 Tax=Phreatobacter stygius TaxID=1940610 RepID=A0A4D7BB59_9HYPH|nr:NAD(P)-dependent oxidoreductase [Phreatobacter stygius]QCI65317.1 NAD(P)-dependent oxidoreductase [Phreatobacter stygius]